VDSISITVNGERHDLAVDADTPLLYVLADTLGLKTPRFGCGLAQCGACSVLVNGREVRSCVYPVSAAAGAEVVTAEGIATDDTPHPLQEELIAAQAPQCGYCYGGMVVKAAELLKTNPSPSRDEIISHMDGHICRCGTYPRLLAAIERAAERMRGDA
jgi:aerobic-type carbon monoxide dehydrogenase small subunit (CoxS/CutS family)